MPENLSPKDGGGAEQNALSRVVSEAVSSDVDKKAGGMGGNSATLPSMPAITSPPQKGDDGLHYSFNNLTHFGWGALCLMAVLVGSRAFSFELFHQQVSNFTTATTRGAVVASQNIKTGAEIVDQEFYQSDSPLVGSVMTRWKNFIVSQKDEIVKQSDYLSARVSKLAGRTGEAVPAELAVIQNASAQLDLDLYGGSKILSGIFLSAIKAPGLAMLNSFAGLEHSASIGIGRGIELVRVSSGVIRPSSVLVSLKQDVSVALSSSQKKIMNGTGQLALGRKAFVGTAIGTGETGKEFVSGAMDGARLVHQSLAGELGFGWDFIVGGFVSAGQSVARAFGQANGQLLAIRQTALTRFASRQKTGLSKLSAGTSVPQSIMSKLAKEKEREVAIVSMPAKIPVSSSNETVPKATPEAGFSFLSGYASDYNLLTLPALAYDRVIFPVRIPLNKTLSSFAGTGSSLEGGIALAWGNFFGGFGGKDLSDQTLREQLKNEILQELSQTGVATVKDSNASSMFNASGIVVMKPTGSSTVDLTNVKKLQDSFSDRVIVNFDKDGQTGVIQPIFRNNKIGPKFQFVLTPIKQ